MDNNQPYKPAAPTPNKINTLMELAAKKPATPKQKNLNLFIDKQAEVNGVAMGVLSDGTPFLTGRGLARLCGVAHSVIQDLTTDWLDVVPKSRINTIRDILATRGLSFEKPYVEVKQANSTMIAYPDAVCVAVLEYYAFEAGGNIKAVAITNFRLLAGQALRDYIYVHVGYDPRAAVPEIWRQFHDRVSLVYNSVPAGFFSIFKEISDMIVTLGQAGVPIDSSFVPDISVGQHWSKHWTLNYYDAHYGERKKFDHNFPDYFPQSPSNPQEAWCYPEAALGEFRRWFREAYIGDGKFEAYLLQKVKKNEIAQPFARLAIAAYDPE